MHANGDLGVRWSCYAGACPKAPPGATASHCVAEIHEGLGTHPSPDHHVCPQLCQDVATRIGEFGQEGLGLKNFSGRFAPTLGCSACSSCTLAMDVGLQFSQSYHRCPCYACIDSLAIVPFRSIFCSDFSHVVQQQRTRKSQRYNHFS